MAQVLGVEFGLSGLSSTCDENAPALADHAYDPVKARRAVLEVALDDLAVRPIRERRAVVARGPDTVMDVLGAGTNVAWAVTEATRARMDDGLGLFRLD